MPKVQPPELKGFMDKKLSSERLLPPLVPTVPRNSHDQHHFACLAALYYARRKPCFVLP